MLILILLISSLVCRASVKKWYEVKSNVSHEQKFLTAVASKSFMAATSYLLLIKPLYRKQPLLALTNENITHYYISEAENKSVSFIIVVIQSRALRTMRAVMENITVEYFKSFCESKISKIIKLSDWKWLFNGVFVQNGIIHAKTELLIKAAMPTHWLIFLYLNPLDRYLNNLLMKSLGKKPSTTPK